MKPEEYPRETFCKHLNIVTGVLVYFERKKSYLRSDRFLCVTKFNPKEKQRYLS